jgi:hypothetical protein
MTGGASSVIASSSLAAALSLGVSATGAWVTFTEASNLDVDPGILAIFGVLVGGFAFTSFCYHLFRLRAAVKMQAHPVNRDQIEAHLSFTALLTGGATPQPAPDAWVEEPAEG